MLLSLRLARRLLGFVFVAGLLAARPPAALAGQAARTPSGPVTYQVFLPFVIRPFRLNLPLLMTAPPAPPSTSFLGTNGSNIDAVDGTSGPDGMLAYFPQLRDKSFYWMGQAGMRWFRTFGSDGVVYGWRFVEPARDTYDWSFWDSLVTSAQQNRVTLLASIGNSVPQWANGSTDRRNQSLDLYTDPMESTSWYRYVYNFVERYDGDGVDDMPGLSQPVKYWELWNEPDLKRFWEPPFDEAHQFNGTVQDYVRLQSVGYAAAKAADPQATIVGPATAQTTGNTYYGPYFLWNWDDFVGAGGLDSVDIISFNHYFDANLWDEDGSVEWILGLVDGGRHGKPVWITETGWSGGLNDYQDKARSLVRSVIIFWAQPWMGRYFWYHVHTEDGVSDAGNRGLFQTRVGSNARGLEPDPLFHPVFRTSELMMQVLGSFDASVHPAALDVGSSARAYHFSRPGLDVWVAWLRAPSGGGTVNIDTGGQTVRVISLYGQDLGTFTGGSLNVSPDPVYLTTDLNWNPNVGRITGRLRDAAQPSAWNNGVPGVSVQITGPVSASAVSDSDGTYSFTGLPEGEYTVTVPGYVTNIPSRQVTVGRELYWGRTNFALTLP
ncbi:MAG: carboxypeptidase regulatory-like domain-containing protein [Anaerolineales bacterium]